jgi:predicted 2-oxoglutarate/Fe(II)-dependent dioxygenase YbiX
MLETHKDRDSCEISVTVTLKQTSNWPIYIKKPNGETAQLVLKPGDAMLYLGCEAEHWRDTLQEEEHTQVFLHYVRSRGPRSMHLFDGKLEARPNIASDETKAKLSKSRYPNNLADYILYLPKVFPDDLLDRILEEYAKGDEWCQSKVGTGGGTEDVSIRGAKTINLSVPETISRNEQIRQQLDADLLFYVNKSIKAYAAAYSECNIVKDSGYELLRYDVGMGYKQHIDNFIDAPRAVSCSIAVNDDYEGGEFTFFDQTISYKQEKGSVLLFPSSFQYPHQVNPVTKGVRYSIITWFS